MSARASAESGAPTRALEVALGHVFHDPALLRRALTHRSHGASNNERLEFLGDSVLNLSVARMLYDDEGASEGQLSYWRAGLVREQTLAEIAREIGLGRMLLLGEGEQRSGGARRASILADALEAVIGAVYVDAGFDAARELVVRLWASRVAELDRRASAKDAKTRLQELLQGRRIALPSYAVTETSGPAHDPRFAVRCDVAGLGLSTAGEGGSRRAAEQQAAEAMIARIEAMEGTP